jgi:pyrroloquinoline quinone biosynthesis protein E
MTPSAANSIHPLSLIAELTHRCPLHCLYCSNPIEMRKAAEELAT